MFASFFGSPATLSRLERCQELKQIPELMKKLRDKVAELRGSSETLGAASVDYRKLRVMSALLDELEVQFTAFNDTRGVVSDAEILMLVSGLADTIARIRAAYNPILAWPRNQRREIADASLAVGVYGVSLAAAAALPLATIGTLIAFFYAAPWLCNKARESSGLNNHKTACIRLLDEWQTVLRNLQSNLELRVPHADRMNFFGSNLCPEEYICLITQEIMREPYICMLDGISYEHEKILLWLTTNRTSPHNRAELDAGRRPEEVLVANRNLKDLIEKFRDQHPDIVYADDDSMDNMAAAAAM